MQTTPVRYNDLSRIPLDRVDAYNALATALRSLQTHICNIKLAEAKSDEGLTKLAALLIAFWEAMWRVGEELSTDDWNRLVGTVRDLPNQNPAAHTASELLLIGGQAILRFSSKNSVCKLRSILANKDEKIRDRHNARKSANDLERIVRPEDIVPHIKQQLSSYCYFGDEVVEWNRRVKIFVWEFTDALLAALNPYRPRDCHASLDFTSVCWFGTPYRFSRGHQANSVKVLWEHWKANTPTVSEKTIAEEIGSENNNFRLTHIFSPMNKQTRKRQKHDAWGTMIQAVGKGLFCLAEPESQK
jgi:hypothetical protein